jgi:hypothetical protein
MVYTLLPVVYLHQVFSPAEFHFHRLSPGETLCVSDTDSLFLQSHTVSPPLRPPRHLTLTAPDELAVALHG